MSDYFIRYIHHESGGELTLPRRLSKKACVAYVHLYVKEKLAEGYHLALVIHGRTSRIAYAYNLEDNAPEIPEAFQVNIPKRCPRDTYAFYAVGLA